MKCCCLKCNNEQTKIFSKEQFDMLFENDRTKISSHIKKSYGKTEQTCICGIQPKEGINVDMLDVTLITAIALTCEKDTKAFERHCIETCLGTIEETRNKVFHFSDIKKMSVDVFEYYWLKLSGSVEVICKFIDKKYQHKIQKRIQKLKSRALVTSDMLKQEELCRAEWRHKCAEFEIIANSELLENEELYANFMTGKAHHEIFTKIDRLNSDIEKTQIHFYGSEKVSQMLDLADPETYSEKAYIPVLLLLEVPEKWNKQRIMDSAYKMKIAMKQDRNIEIKSCSAEDLNILAYIFWKMFSDIQKLRREMQLFIGSILTFAGINTTKKESMQVCMFINDQHKHSQRRRGYIRYRNKNITMF
ncbi:uncharacterized protein LOC143081668 [Mytilus galloprovincialis]|uniref:uncharacterized protein LOC143081668 n=1 Tax=Mytilus galloprovincialis TaxID=29158 RepID=UPI003F7B53F5